MSYHLIEQPSYFRREAPCGPGCQGMPCAMAPPTEHRQDYAVALCGREVVRYRDEYCASGIAKPGSPHDWCRECIMMVEWTPEEQEAFRWKGFLTESETDQAGIAMVAALRKRGSDAPGAWADFLERMREEIPGGFPETLREWTESVMAHVDNGGPEPSYWPEEARDWTGRVRAARFPENVLGQVLERIRQAAGGE